MEFNESAVERVVLENLRERYVGEGYAFYEYPGRALVPSFLESYRPDAIAIGPRGRVVIEVKRREASGEESELPRIASLFADHPDWKFVLVYLDDEIQAPLAQSSKSQVEDAIGEMETLAAQGHAKAAFVLGWAVLEAAHRAALNDECRDQPQPPQSVLESLEREGFLDRELAKPLWDRLPLRTAVVHGDLEAEVDERSVGELLRAARQVIGRLLPPRTDA